MSEVKPKELYRFQGVLLSENQLEWVFKELKLELTAEEKEKMRVK